jgi:hypothetical protein
VKAAQSLMLESGLSSDSTERLINRIFPFIVPDILLDILGSGIVTFDPESEQAILTVLSATDKFYAEYNLSAVEIENAQDVDKTTPGKGYWCKCQRLFKRSKKDGSVELWACFSENPVLVDQADWDKTYTWPNIQLRRADVVELLAERNELPHRDPAFGHTLASSFGVFKFPSSDTPGGASRQITQTIVFHQLEDKSVFPPGPKAGGG